MSSELCAFRTSSLVRVGGSERALTGRLNIQGFIRERYYPGTQVLSS